MPSIIIDDLEANIENAAKAWMEWQFPLWQWENASSSMKDKFRDGAKVVLAATGLFACSEDN